jgi:glycosyltransferase involved in cell wall biosynthesis
MPVYKTKEEYLRTAIESVLQQTESDFEFLILDDCPENDREAVVKSYNDPRIVYLKNDKNLGISTSRNKLLDMAKGKYIAVFDHDDICLPTRFEKQKNYLDTHPEVGVVSSYYERFPRLKTKKRPQENTQIENYMMQGCAVLHPAAMIRASVLKENGIRYEAEFSPSEDYALFCRLIGKTRFYNIPQVLYRYRDHDENTSKLQKRKMISATQKIQDFVRREHPDIVSRSEKDAVYSFRFFLFGILPIAYIKKRGASYPFGLDKCSFLRIKRRMEII